MGNLTITATDVEIVRIDKPLIPLPNGESLAKGMYGRLDASTGKGVKGNATTAAEIGYGGIVCGDDGAANVSLMRDGILDVGDALASMNYGAKVYLSDTDSLLADADDGTVDIVIGYVYPGWAFGTADKLLKVEVQDG